MPFLVAQTRKICTHCNIKVGPHYYYARGSQRGSLQGHATLDFHMLHEPRCVCLMLYTSQKIFVQVGWLHWHQQRQIKSGSAAAPVCTGPAGSSSAVLPAMAITYLQQALKEGWHGS